MRCLKRSLLACVGQFSRRESCQTWFEAFIDPYWHTPISPWNLVDRWQEFGQDHDYLYLQPSEKMIEITCKSLYLLGSKMKVSAIVRDLERYHAGKLILDWTKETQINALKSDVFMRRHFKSLIEIGSFDAVSMKYSRMRGAEISMVCLSGLDFYGSDLSGANFYRSDLSGSDLRNTFLNGAIISTARLSDANLEKCFARGADFYGSDLSNTCLERGDFRGADFRNANFNLAIVSGADFSGALVSGACFRDCDLSECVGLPDRVVKMWNKKS